MVVATHRNLEEQVTARDVSRRSLSSRVCVSDCDSAVARERPEDIPALVEHFARQLADQNNWKPVTFSREAIEKLVALLTWPGNVRELRNVVERAPASHQGATTNGSAQRWRRALPQGDSGRPQTSVAGG